MKLLICTLLLLSAILNAQPIRVIAFGAHPDDCDLGAAGTAAKFAAMGHAVKFGLPQHRRWSRCARTYQGNDVDAALSQAKVAGRPLLVDFSAAPA